MGHSEKAASAAASCFGEGMKVEVNRLVVAGMDVRVFTGYSDWLFSHCPIDGSGSGNTVLFMSPRPCGAPPVWCPHTSFVIHRRTPAMTDKWPIDTGNFLFLRPSDPANCFRGHTQEVLLSEEHVGRVYVHGIHVQTFPTLLGFGLNYVGSADTYDTIGLGRDRNSVQLWALIRYLPQSVTECQARSQGVRPLVRRLYEVVMEQPDSAVKDLSWYGGLAPERNLGDEFVKIFQEVHGATCFPVSSSSSGSSRDIEYLGYQPVQVPDLLLRIMRKSARCPTVDFLWAQLKEKIANLTEWTPQNEGDMAIACKYKSLVDEWFSPHLQGHQILYKNFPPGNPHHVVVPFVDASGDRFYAVDVSLLHTAKVHEWLAGQGKRCMDPQLGDQCGGMCQLFRFRQALLNAVGDAGIRNQLEEQEHLAHLRRSTRELPNVSTPSPSPKTPNTVWAKGPQCPDSKPPSSGPGPSPGPSSGPRSGIPSPRATGSPAVGRQLDFDGEQEPGLDEDDGRRARTDFSLEATRANAQGDHSLLAACVRSGGGGAQPEAQTQRQPRSRFLKECWQEAESAMHLHLDRLAVVTFPGGKCSIPTYRTHTGATAGLSPESIDGLASLIAGLLHGVFRWGREQIQATACVWWEEDSKIAFNRQGTLFFNAMYFQAYQHGQPANRNAAHSYWFVVLCHELAHNVAKGHDKQHEWVEESLIVH
mmetsp:Transcript_11159/g.20053  ORF Transcript_11159/g.20053 Transcript_11159/m.20053 type:complete len:702 (-) Transcript_11159:1500-3605(-)